MRDGDLKAGYTIEENGRFFHYRVPYDVEKVVHDLDGVGLDDGFKARWSRFLRSAYDEEWSRL